MDYQLLTAKQQAQIAHQKLLDLEAEHARLELDLRLAVATGIENDNVEAAKGQLEVLVQQIATLTSWLIPPPDEDAVGRSNGQRAITAES